MVISYDEVISKAESAFLNGKRGTFALVRTPDGKIWYAGPGVQTAVLFLRIRFRDRVIDEDSFSGVLIIRADPKGEKEWFVFYNPNEKNMRYIASSWEGTLDFSLTAVAEAPESGSAKEPITIQAAFSGRYSAVSRVQNKAVCNAVILQAQLFTTSYGDLQAAPNDFNAACQSNGEFTDPHDHIDLD